LDDIEIIRSVQAGDSESFSLIVQKYHRHLLNFIYRLTGNEQVVEDIGQEVFFSIYKSIRTFNTQRGISYFVILQVIYILGFRWTVLLPDRMLIVGAFCAVLAVMALYAAAVIDAYRKAARTEISCPRAPYHRWYFYVAVWLLGWVLVSGAAFRYVTENLAEAFIIPTGSMEPTILSGDRVLADKTAYQRMAPQKGDVVILVYPDDRSKRYVKRIAALPGETVAGSDGTSRQVPHGFVYVLGDNSGKSFDSRQFGFVPIVDLIAKVRQVYFSSGRDGIRWKRIGKIVSS
jgi:signal peptidase I